MLILRFWLNYVMLLMWMLLLLLMLICQYIDFDDDIYVDVDANVDKIDCPTQLSCFVRFDLCICVS